MKHLPEDEQIFHDWLLRYIKKKHSREYKEIYINPSDERNHEYMGHYPDVIFSNYGQVLLIAEVETEISITEEKAKEWKKMASLGTKLIILVPRQAKSRVIDLLWKNDLMGTVGVGEYEVIVNI
ncbi:MAG: hypothetical protein AB1488_10700 [Nitrospirota bacterium]